MSRSTGLMLIAAAASSFLAVFCGCASAPPTRHDDLTGIISGLAPLEITDVEGVTRRLFLDGRVYVSGQPSHDALIELAERGVTAVVNLRTPQEYEDRERVPFDEAALADSLGLDYVSLPLGGDDHPYRPSVLSGLDEVLRTHQGRVLVHCLSGGRASYVWAGYLIRHRGWELNEGLRRGMAIGISEHPLQGLLDKDLVLQER